MERFTFVSTSVNLTCLTCVLLETMYAHTHRCLSPVFQCYEDKIWFVTQHFPNKNMLKNQKKERFWGVGGKVYLEYSKVLKLHFCTIAVQKRKVLFPSWTMTIKFMHVLEAWEIQLKNKILISWTYKYIHWNESKDSSSMTELYSPEEGVQLPQRFATLHLLLHVIVLYIFMCWEGGDLRVLAEKYCSQRKQIKVLCQWSF